MLIGGLTYPSTRCSPPNECLWIVHPAIEKLEPAASCIRGIRKVEIVLQSSLPQYLVPAYPRKELVDLKEGQQVLERE